MLLLLVHPLLAGLVPPTLRTGIAPPALAQAPTCRARAILACAPSQEEWRDFRAKLISGGIKVTSDEDGGDAVVDEMTSSEDAVRESVAPANEDLLKSQNEALWREYLDGAWAHVAPFPEPGGLLLRQPLQAQLMWMMREGGSNQWAWGEKLAAKLEKELPDTADGDAEDSRLERWQGNTMYMYRLAETLIEESLESLAAKSSDGKISWQKLDEDQKDLITLYSAAQDSWQEVCLVLGGSSEGGAASPAAAGECVVINRPIARSMSRELAELLLNGAREVRTSGLPPLYSSEFVDRFMQAFGNEAAVYVGGPDQQDASGLVIHGFDLPGAAEVSPGTRIFSGGIEAAVDAVLDGTRSPLDFRFFVGRRSDVSTGDGAWRAVACARPIALKQCLGLPKPLWHEVQELCGGELAELSKIELLKRTDLQ